MKRISILFIIWLCLAGSLLLSGCRRVYPTPPDFPPDNYWDGEDAEYVTVKPDCSAYGIWDRDWRLQEIEYYLDPNKETLVRGEMENYVWTLKVPKGTTDLYACPLIALYQETEEQVIPLDQDYPIQTDCFSVEGVAVPELVEGRKNKDDLTVEVFVIPKNNQYPRFLNLYYNGLLHRFNGRNTNYDDSGNVMNLTYKCRMPDLNTAAMAMKYGSLQYHTLETMVPALDATFSCIDGSVTVHIIE